MRIFVCSESDGVCLGGRDVYGSRLAYGEGLCMGVRVSRS